MLTENQRRERRIVEDVSLRDRAGISVAAPAATAISRLQNKVGPTVWKRALAAPSVIAARRIIAAALPARASAKSKPAAAKPAARKAKRAEPEREPDEADDEAEEEDPDEEPEPLPEPEPDPDAEPDDDEDEEDPEEEERRMRKAKVKKAKRAEAEAHADRILARGRTTATREGLIASYMSLTRDSPPPQPARVATPAPRRPRVTRAAVELAKKKPAVIAAASRSGKPIEDYARSYVAQFPQEFGLAG